MTPEEQAQFLARQKRKNTAVGIAIAGFVALIFIITLLKQNI